MPPIEDDWSDSDDDALSDTETSVQLGIPDGPLDSPADHLDVAVSRIGGHPAFLTSNEPPLSSSHCGNCSRPMHLLVQLWCPLENSPNDRALYIWGCTRGACQRKGGSVRAWRGLRFNEKYAAKLEKKRAREAALAAERAKVAAEEEKKRAVPKINPFALKSSSGPSLGLGSQIFGGDDDDDEDEETAPNTTDQARSIDEDTDEESDENDEEEDLVTAMASSSLESSEWTTSPSYAACYLSTVSEYVPAAAKPKVPKHTQTDDMPEPGKDKDMSWIAEGYENSMETDHVFDRFTQRAEYQGDQCVRYDISGTPLPFANDAVFDRLFPTPPSDPLPVTKPDFKVVPPLPKRTFSSSTLPPCPHCRGKRVFECQLMPNLINVLKAPDEKASKKKQNDEERRKEVERVLKRSGELEDGDMEWGTCMVFSCEQDCSVEAGQQVKSCWREEFVLVQWDN